MAMADLWQVGEERADAFTNSDPIDKVEVVREAWAEFRALFDALKDELNGFGSAGAFERRRLEMYAVGTGGDEGMGISLDGFLDEIEQVFAGTDGEE